MRHYAVASIEHSERTLAESKLIVRRQVCVALFIETRAFISMFLPLTMYLLMCQVGAFPTSDFLVHHNTAYSQTALSSMHANVVQIADDQVCDKNGQNTLFMLLLIMSWHVCIQMASLGGRVNSIDAGIKSASKVRVPFTKGSGGRACTAIHTINNEHKQAIGQYCCSNSTWELSPGLMEMRLRFEVLDPGNLLHYGQVWYCDDPKLYGNPIRVAFNGMVGCNLQPGDDGIKQDLYHGAERFDGVLQSGSSNRWLKYLNRVSSSFKCIHRP